MKQLILFLFAAVLCQGAAAQQIEQLYKREDLLLMQMTDAQRQAHREKSQKAHEAAMKSASFNLGDLLFILPDSILYVDEPIDVYHSVDVFERSTTVMAELYDLNGKRAKRILREEFTPDTEVGAGGNINLRLTFDNPGRYELVLYDTAVPIDDLEDSKICRILEILPKPTNPEN